MLSLLIFSLLSAASAHVLHEGSCPDLKPVENFNITAYQGTWYEIMKFTYEHEMRGNCSSAEYTLDGDHVNVKNTHVVDGVQYYVDGTAKLADDANHSAKLVVNLKVGNVSRESNLLVLATDYTHYAIAYSCKVNEKNKSHQDFAWVLSRTKTLEGDAKTAVDNFLKENSVELDSAKFVKTDFTEESCKFTSTTPVTPPTKS